MASKYKTLFFPNGDHQFFPGQKWVGEHRVVMAEHLGRSLQFNELVHHRDHDGRNNALGNLELISRSAHSKLHNTGRTRLPSEIAGTSAALKGRPKTPEHVAKMRTAMQGKKHTAETKEALSAMSKGVPKSDQTKVRMKASWTPGRRAAAAERMAQRNRLRRAA